MPVKSYITNGQLLSADGYANYTIITGDEKTALVNTVPDECVQEFVKTLPCGRLDYIVFTNTDKRRTGALEELLRRFPDAEIIASAAGIRNLHEILNSDFRERVAKDSEIIDLGGISLEIMITPRLGWPDTMMVYAAGEKALMSGQMFCIKASREETEEYFAGNIGAADFAETAVERVKKKDIAYIYPADGQFLNDVKFAISEYESIISSVSGKHENTAAVIYAGNGSGYTAELAAIVSAEMRGSGFSVKLVNCSENPEAAVKAVNGADALCFASPTVNRRALPELMDVISRIDIMKMRRTPCIVTGSYGWGGEALGTIAGYLKLLGMKVFEKPFGTIFKPSENDKKELRSFTNRFIEEIKDDNK